MLQKNIIKKYSKNHLDSDTIKEIYKKYTATFHNPEKIQHIKDSKEEQYQEGFLRDLFCDILGYTINPEPNYNLITEKKNESDSRKADGAIIIDGKVQAVIELKGCDTTDLSKVENQAFGYKAHNPTANLVIISNFEKLRLYIEDASDFLEFNIFTMNQEQFELLYLCLSLENVKSNIAQKLKNESVSAEIDITDKLYADYSTFKRALFENICELNLEGESLPLASKAETAFSATPSSGDTPQRPEINKLLLFKKTQKLLDRILFVLFCEDRGLLPENSIAKIIDQWQKLKELDAYQPLYNRFQNYFNHINTGYKSETDPSYVIFAYNGGLFKPDEILDNIKISDDVLFIHTKKLSDYDYESEVSVDILGHIFEHSLTEIEEIQEEIATASCNKGLKSLDNSTNTTSKRKKDGVFYTPAYITKYIVENTIGKLCDDKKSELGINDETFAEKRRNKNQKVELDEKLKSYRKWLLSLKICDPACGSGAFLNAALQFLKTEHALIDELNAKLYGDTLIFQEVENAILENNLFGVDINEESVEIAKLSLWLHTAQKGRKLSTLNNNIKCGNSLIDDVEIAGEKAFCWEKEFPEIFSTARDLSPLSSNTDSKILSSYSDVDFSKESLFHVTTATHNSRPSSRPQALEWESDKAIKLTIEEEIFITDVIKQIVKENNYKILAYNICQDHLHLLIACEEKQLPEIMQNIKGKTSFERNKVFENKYEHLWAQKYGCKKIFDKEQLENTISYIEYNREKHKLPSLTTRGFSPLANKTEKKGFDVVIGNPPYVNLNNIKSETEKNFYKSHYSTVKEMCDLYSIFTEKSKSLLCKDGVFGFIFSNSWLGIKSFYAFREFLAKEVKVTKLVELPEKVFADATVKTCICFYSNIKPTEKDDIEIYKCENYTFISKGFSLSYKQILGSESLSFSFDRNINLNKVKTQKLKDIMFSTCGIKTANDGKYILSEKKDDDCYLFLRGRGLKKWYKPENVTIEYIWYKPELMKENVNARPRQLENFYVDEKILIQEIAQEINATLDKEKFLCNDTINVIYKLNDSYSMKYILVLLNSKLINFWFKKLYPSGLHIKINQLENILIPNISLSEQQPFIDLADKMLTLNADLQKSVQRFLKRVQDNLNPAKISSTLESFYTIEFADFVKELAKQKVKLSLKQQDEWEEYFAEYKKDCQAFAEEIATTDNQINQLVYKLYDLTDEEIAVVEGR